MSGLARPARSAPWGLVGLALALAGLLALVWLPAFNAQARVREARLSAAAQTARFNAIADQAPALRAALAAQADERADPRLWPTARTRALAGAAVQAEVGDLLRAAGLTVSRATLRLEPGPEAAVLAVFEVEGGYADLVRGLARLDTQTPRAFVTGLDVRVSRGRARAAGERFVAVIDVAAPFTAITAEGAATP